MQYPHDFDPIVVVDFFVDFLKSIEKNILALLVTDDNEQRLKIKSVRDSTRLIHSRSLVIQRLIFSILIQVRIVNFSIFVTTLLIGQKLA